MLTQPALAVLLYAWASNHEVHNDDPRGYVVGYVEAYSDEEAATKAEKQGEIVVDIMDDIIVVPEEESWQSD